MGFPGDSDHNESASNEGDLSLIPGLGRSPGEGKGFPLQYSGLENPMDRGAWQGTVFYKCQLEPVVYSMVQFCILYPCLFSVYQFHWSLQEECWSLQLLLCICLFLISDQLVFASYVSKLIYLVHIRLGLCVFLWTDPLITTYCLFLSLVIVFAEKSALSHITLATPVFSWKCLRAQWLHHVWLFATPWTVAHQAPLSMGIFHTRILEWVPTPSSRGSSWPRDQTQISYVSCIGRRVLYH